MPVANINMRKMIIIYSYNTKIEVGPTFEVEKTARFVPVASAAVHVTALSIRNER